MNDIPSKKTEKVREIAITALFAAIIFLMTFTPIGFIPIGPINATIVHIPVIIASLILGPRIGAMLGAIFGLASFIKNTMTPLVLSFVFSPLVPVPGLGRGSLWALVVCFLPRILVGVVPYYIDRLLSSFRENDWKWRYISLFTAGVFGSLTNTLLVLHLIYFIFRDTYAAARNLSVGVVYGSILSIITTNGIAEAILAGVCTAAIVKAVLRFREGRR